MSDEAGVWERPLGLMGIWGDIIYQWLNDLLPSDAQIVVNDEVCTDVLLPLLKIIRWTIIGSCLVIVFTKEVACFGYTCTIIW